MLCKNSAYVVKKPAAIDGSIPVITGQVTWSRFGGPKQAWKEAKKRAGLKVKAVAKR